jgi:hypothetical protein
MVCPLIMPRGASPLFANPTARRRPLLVLLAAVLPVRVQPADLANVADALASRPGSDTVRQPRAAAHRQRERRHQADAEGWKQHSRETLPTITRTSSVGCAITSLLRSSRGYPRRPPSCASRDGYTGSPRLAAAKPWNVRRARGTEVRCRRECASGPHDDSCSGVCRVCVSIFAP